MRGRVSAALVGGLVAGLAACAVGRPTTAATPPLVGVVRSVPDDDHPAFLRELRAQGWIAGDAVTVLPADGDAVAADVEAATGMLRDWSRDGVDVVLALSTAFAQAAVETVPATPVLFLVNDPVAAGLVRDPAEPEGNATGVTFWTPADRTLELAAEVLGGLDRLGYLAPAGDDGVPGHLRRVVAAAEQAGIEVVDARFSGAEDVAAAVAHLADEAVDAVIVSNSTAVVRFASELEAELDRHGLPAVANNDAISFAVVTLAPDGEEVRRQLARQTARLLAGADVADVPVEDPRRFTLIVDRTKAEELGLAPIDVRVLRRVDVVR